MLRQSTLRKKAAVLFLLGICAVWTCPVTALAQMGAGGGGGPGAGQGGAPAFEDPKFRDRVWEAGGPRMSGLHTGKLVKAVQIVGNQSVSKSKILSHMQTRQDRTFDEKQLWSDIHELYRTDLFRKITPLVSDYADGVVVKLEIAEQPTVTEVVFHGNIRLEDRMLQKHAGIEIGDPVNPFSVDMARQRLLDLYYEKGMNQAAIEVMEGHRLGDRRVYFSISEGPVEKIWGINFVGNTVFSSPVLATKIKSRDAKGGLTPYFVNVANRNKIDEDKSRLVAFYRSLGYFKARVDYRINYYASGEYIDLTFVVDEGPQFRVRNVSVIGNQYFSTSVLMAALQLKTGEPFKLLNMNRDQIKLRNEFYGREGFVYVDISPEPRFIEESDEIDIVYRITEGDQHYAGEIRVHIDGDSSHTRQNVVVNHLGFREGELIDLAELEASERRLKFSQIFETNPAIGEPPRIEVEAPDQTGDFDY
jgi:outer membrane protein insertion porin family